MPSNAVPPIYDNFDAGLTGSRAIFSGGINTTPGRARPSTTGSDNVAGRTGVDSLNDSYSEIQIVTLTTNAKAGAVVRASSGWNGYTFLADTTTTPNVFLYRVATGAYTALQSTTLTLTTPFRLRLEVIGATLYTYLDGLAVFDPTVDVTYVSGQPAFQLIGNTNVANQELEDWEAGPLPAGSYSPRRHPQASPQPLPDRVYRMR